MAFRSAAIKTIMVAGYGVGMGGLLFFLLLSPVNDMADDTVPRDGREAAVLKMGNNVNGIHAHVTVDDSIRHMVDHPAFKGFGRYLLPRDNVNSDLDRPLNQVGSLMPYHDHVDPGVVVAAINHMIDRINGGDTLFHDFYTGRQKQVDPVKASTGLFFFRGRPGAPFAVICPGGGFAYVGSLHEGFPLATALSRKGYNAFVLRYRTGSRSKAAEDLAVAVSYVFRNAGRLEVGVADYSLWAVLPGHGW